MAEHTPSDRGSMEARLDATRSSRWWPAVDAWVERRGIKRLAFKAMLVLAAAGERRAGLLAEPLGMTILEVFAIRQEFETALGMTLPEAAYAVQRGETPL